MRTGLRLQVSQNETRSQLPFMENPLGNTDQAAAVDDETEVVGIIRQRGDSTVADCRRQFGFLLRIVGDEVVERFLRDVVSDLLKLFLDLVESLAINDKDLFHVFSQQPTAVADVDGGLCSNRKSLEIY